MLIISTREFRQKQKMYLDLVDKNVQVIVKRGKGKAYALTVITETDLYFSDPAIIQRIADSLEQAERGELVTIPRDGINDILGV
jgi:PHD/YefM family antitoxin component YafN of YafNO toxin-antitoxin module